MSGHSLDRLAALGAGACFMLAGCAVGPDFKAPVAPAAHSFVAEAAPALPRPDATLPVVSDDAPHVARWWHEFGSAELDVWVDEALLHSLDVQTSDMALRRAHAVLDGETGLLLLPTADLGVEPSRQRALNLPGQRPPTVLYDVYAANVDVSYRLDLFGSSRRQLEADAANAEAASGELAAARLSVVSNVVAEAIESAALKARVAHLNAFVSASEERVAAERKRLLAGASSEDAVALLVRQLASDRALLPPVEQAHVRARHALAVLMGRLPENAPADLDFAQLVLPQHVPTAVASALIHDRPDIVAAEARVHAANARYGQAIANLYPQIQLTGAIGSESYLYRTWFTGPQGVFSAAALLTQPLFRGGALKAAKTAAGIDRDDAVANYQLTVLHAFQAVGDSLYAMDTDRTSVIAATDGADASALLAEHAVARERSGSYSHTTVLPLTENRERDAADLIAARAQLWMDLVAYYHATGQVSDFQ
jgi:NodT family efflux transporter outer membrane factor (OMF) lipoprotein